MKKIIVTGGCGFIGSNLVKKLLLSKPDIKKNGITYEIAETQWKAPVKISSDRVAKINQIVAEIGNYVKTKGKEGKPPDADNEIKEILAIPNNNLVVDRNDNTVDVHFIKGQKEYCFDIKTAQPNQKGWIDLKKTTLKLSARLNKRVYGAVAAPYNPNSPKPYDAIGFQYMQMGNDVFVGKDFWDLIGGKGCYEDLSAAFKKIGSTYFEKTLDKAGVDNH